MPASGGEDNAAVVEAAAAIVDHLSGRLSELTAAVHHMLLDEVAELGGDSPMADLLRDTVEGNIETVFSAIRHEIPLQHFKPPTVALEHARRLAQRGVSVNALVRAYRLGHQVVLSAAREEIRASDLDLQTGLDVDSQIAEVTFTYIDWISQQVIVTYQEEHDRWLENRNNIRSLRVHEILKDSDLDADAAGASIRYRLNSTHLAIILWYDRVAKGDELVAMEKFIRDFASWVGIRNNPLFIPVDRQTGWGWIPLEPGRDLDAIDRLRAFAKTSPNAPCIAAGDSQPGVDGFRRSHRQAQDARDIVWALGPNASRVVAISDPGVGMVALLGARVDAAADWVAKVLGPLASRTDNDERLRTTLRVFLRTGSSFKAAAEELNLHANSVKYRVSRAIERRGRPIADDRLDVEVALLLCHWYGPALLHAAHSG
ncbi:MAG TPA: helix-turn-helix domain-containing protein [Mycobacterium sp.]|nr:helix-turn-helix domain-containing protein [Mycobacterium sp.]